MKKFFALCLAAVMVLSLAACGSNEKAEETQAASAKKWVVATDTVFKPFEYTDASGNFVGIDVDILAAVAADSDITGFGDLKGKDVAVKTGTQGATYAESLKDEYGFNLVYFEDSPTMYQAVVGGQCVACFEDTPIMQASIKDGGLALKVLDSTANDGGDYGFAIFNSANQELLDMFNAGLANIKANGTYDKILAKYLG